jgi:hypothetical protein
MSHMLINCSKKDIDCDRRTVQLNLQDVRGAGEG